MHTQKNTNFLNEVELTNYVGLLNLCQKNDIPIIKKMISYVYDLAIFARNLCLRLHKFMFIAGVTKSD